jgi:integrase
VLPFPPVAVFSRPDSKWWWLYLETTREKEKTDILIGQTASQRRDSRKLADDRYHQRMNELAARLYKLPSASPSVRFDRYAQTYAADVIAHHRGAPRELELLKHLVAFFEGDLLTDIDQDRARQYQTFRRLTVSAMTVNREVSLLKGMLRDAVPKYLATNPLAGMKRLKVVPPKRRLMTVEEERKLLAVADDQDRALLILGLDTLVRLGDLLDLRREDRAGPWMTVTDPKSSQPYDVALSPRAQKALDLIDHDYSYYFVKFRKAETPRGWGCAVRKRLALLCEKAGLPYGWKRNGITFHWGTRRTGATRLLIGKRQPLPVVQRLGGWKKPDVLLEIYSEAGRNDLLKAVGSFPNRSRSKAKRP